MEIVKAELLLRIYQIFNSLLDLQLVCNNSCDIPKKDSGVASPLNCLVWSHPLLLWPGRFRNLIQKMFLSYN